MRRRSRPGALALAAGLLVAAAGSAAAEAGLSLQGSALILTEDGVARPPGALVGATLTLVLEDGRTAEVRIDGVTADPRIPAGDVWLYALSVREDDGRWAEVCEPEADGARHAILQPAGDGQVAILCTAGAFGKCIRFGYRPWAMHDGTPLDAYWRACVHMVRADYCGTDQPTTRDNMLVDYYDALGIAGQDARPGLRFEAAWGEAGALCVAHTRVPQNMTPAALEAACPRLRGRVGTACTEAGAARHGAPLLWNASRGDGVPE